METYMTIEELAKYLKIAEQTIWGWVRNRDMPFHKIKKSIRFRLSEIEWWIDNCAIFPCGGDYRVERFGFVPDVISLEELREEEERAEMSSGDIEE